MSFVNDAYHGKLKLRHDPFVQALAPEQPMVMDARTDEFSRHRFLPSDSI